ncbi:MAG: hypothetical protein JWO30_1949 [Fibrobacteres bacterium]|nr:hypothetical protein [Fibrobacterota bacterium]
MKNWLFAMLLLAAVPCFSSAPVVGWGNGSYSVADLRFDANEKCVWFMGVNSVGESFAFRYPYYNSGNTLEESKGLLSTLSMARTLGKRISLNVYSTAAAPAYYFNAVQVSP